MSDEDGDGIYSTDPVDICLADGCATMSWTDGSYITETAFTITDAAGNVVASGSDGILSQATFGVNDDSCVPPGCTDDTAENFNPDANADDGSCEYDCATGDTEALFTCYYYGWVNPIYTVEEATNFGYDCTCVEEPVLGCMDETACNYDETATLDSGCDFVSCACDGSTVIVDGGSWQTEVSWTITDCDGNILAEGGAPYAECVGSLPENYVINMFDSFGDGWNGNVMTIDGEGDYTITTGTDAIASVGACAGAGCTDENADNYDADAATEDGSCVYSCPFVDGVDITTVTFNCYDYVWNIGGYTVEDMIGFGFDCTCVENPVMGCTIEDATNYNPDAQMNDGSCEFDCAGAGLSDATVWWRLLHW